MAKQLSLLFCLSHPSLKKIKNAPWSKITSRIEEDLARNKISALPYNLNLFTSQLMAVIGAAGDAYPKQSQVHMPKDGGQKISAKFGQNTRHDEIRHLELVARGIE